MKNRILNWLLIVGVVATGIWGYMQYRTRMQYETYIQNLNQRSYYDMVGNFKNISTLTSKAIVSTSPDNKAMLLTDIWWQANNAQDNLTRLPVDGGTVQRTTKFLTQIGDFSYTLAKKSSKGLPISNAEINKLQELHNQIGKLTDEIQNLNNRISHDGGAFSDFITISQNTKKSTGNLVGGTITRLDKQMQTYPTLIYDGPFSDHIQQKKPLGISGPILTTEQAKNKAIEFFDKQAGKSYSIKNTGIAKGKIPAYTMHILSKDASEEAYLDISRKGGNIVFLLNTRVVTKRNLDTTQARVYAENFLKRNGIWPMVPSYSYRQGNVSVLTFAYFDKGVVIYPDLVKVKVALDNGQIVGFESLGYLMNHHQRNLAKAEFPKEKAREKLPSYLKIVSEKLVLIPTETLSEKLCYEYRVSYRGDTFLIYLNAISGAEERILKVMHLPNGEFTM